MVKLKEFFQRYWLFILLAFLATVIVGVVILRPKAPGAPKLASLAQPYFSKANLAEGRIFYHLSLDKEVAETPKELPVFSAQLRSYFDYSKLARPNLEGEKIVDSALQAAGFAKGFLKENNRWTPELENGEYETNFLKIGGFEVYEIQFLEDAEIIITQFYPKINDYLIVGRIPFSGLMEVWVAKNGRIQKVKDELAQYDQTKPINYPLTSLDEAWQQIEEQKGTVVYVGTQEETYDLSPVKISDVTINKAFLAYFQEEEQPSFLQPIWVFQGKAIFRDGTETEVAIYLPAIEEKYFITPGF